MSLNQLLKVSQMGCMSRTGDGGQPERCRTKPRLCGTLTGTCLDHSYLVGLHDVHSCLLQDSWTLQQRPNRLLHPAQRTSGQPEVLEFMVHMHTANQAKVSSGPEPF